VIVWNKPFDGIKKIKNSMLKLGIVGLGPWGQRYIETIKNKSDIQLVAACRKNNERPDFLPELCKFYTEPSQMLWSRLDGLILAADPYTNLKVAQNAIIYGLPILIEKPVAFHTKDIEQLMGYGNVLSIALVNYTHLFSPAFIKLQEIVKNKEIVEIYSKGYSKRAPRIFSSLWDYAPHDLAMGLTLCNTDLTEPQYIEQQYSENEGNNYKLEVKYYHQHIVKHTMIVGNAGPTKERYFEVLCKDGTRVIYNDQTDNKLTVDNESISISNMPPLANTLECFKKLVDGGTDVRAGWILTKKITKILEQCDNL
jgi:predicted dehydrogenase